MKEKDEFGNIFLDNDQNWTLAEWLVFIQEQIDTYGPESILFTDAGYNSVSLWLKPSRKIK